jgi:hypothetical protein
MKKINLMANTSASARDTHDRAIECVQNYNKKYSQNVIISGTKSIATIYMYDNEVSVAVKFRHGFVYIGVITSMEEISESIIKRELQKIFALKGINC